MDQQTFGGCEGPDAMYVKLISSDGHEFIVKREHALTSGTIKGELKVQMAIHNSYYVENVNDEVQNYW